MRAPTAILVSLSILALFGAFLIASRSAAGARGGRSRAGLSWWDEGTEQFVRRKVAAAYVDAIDERRGREAFFRAMSSYVAFDRYSRVIPPSEYRTWVDDTRGRYAGLGIKVDKKDDGLLLRGVWPGGPADRAGLRVGETITAADGKRLGPVPVESVTRYLKGAPNTQVTVSVIAGPRPDTGPAVGPERNVVVTRGVIKPPTVFSRWIDQAARLATIRLTDFTNETGPEFDRHLNRYLQQGLRGLVLDLRHNGGGVLGVATGIVDRFLARGVIVRMEGRASDARRVTGAHAQAKDQLHLPLVVLVDGRSASASEIVAGAIQDHRRGVVLGTRTYGKFLVQSIIDIPQRHAAIKLTTSRYYLPSGRSYEATEMGQESGAASEREPQGLLPDVVVELSDELSLRVQRQWANEEGKPWGETPRYPEVPAEEIDPQLQSAMDLLLGGVARQRIRPSAPQRPDHG